MRAFVGFLAAGGGVLLAACGSNSVSVRSPASAAEANPAESLSLSVADLSRPRVAPASLVVTGLVVSHVRVGKALLQRLEFSPVSASDFVEVQICGTLEAGCDEVGRSVLTHVPLRTERAGQALAAARACVHPGRSLERGSSCGPWSYAEFAVLASTDSETRALLSERDTQSARLAEWAQRLMQALAEFEARSENCLARKEIAERVTLLRGIVANTLVLGEDLVQKSIEAKSIGETGEPGLASDIPAERVEQPLSHYEARLARFREYDGAVRRLAESRGSFASSQPMSAVRSLSQAVFDLFTTSHGQNGACEALDTAEREVAAIQAAIQTVNARISEIDAIVKEGDTP